MPPENLVNYTASPEEPSLDAMRYALAQRGATPNQQQRPLDGVTDTFKRLAAEFNPLMMGRTLQDAPKIMYNAVAAPVAGTWAGALRNLQAAGAAQAYGALGMPQDAAAAQSRTQPVTPQSGQLKLRSSAGQQTQEALGEAFNALQLPPVGPGSGMPGTAPLNPRPMLTPNDVRVMGARAAHTVREAGQIPTDIANVRGAGIQRLSPLTGQPSVGSRIGSAIEGTAQTAGRVGNVARDVGQSTADYMQMRRDMGLSPVPGVPPEFFPDLNLYAMRPKDSTLVTPSVPPTKNVTSLDVGNAPYAAIHDVGADRPELRPSDALAYLASMDLDVPRTNAQGIAPITSERQAAFNAFIAAQANALYPDAPNSREAMLAMDDRFSRQADRDASRIQLYDQFRESPEGKAVGMDDLPSSTELQARHAAASQWLNSTLLNYAKRKLGAEGDPLVQQASQGFTMLPAENVRMLANAVNEDVLKRRRAQAGMPVAGTVAPAIRDKSVELADATAAVEQLQQRREEYRNVAMQQGLPDPAQLPEYAATTNPLRVAVAKRDKLQEELNNLELGRDYEKLSDIAVTVDTQPNLLGKIEYPQRQFYPSVTRARPDETLFHLSRTGPLQSTGFNELATQFYDDVIRGNIPIDKLKSLTVEKYVRSKAEGRVAEEKRQAQATAALKNSIESRMQQDMQRYVKPEDYFGNVGVLELSTSTGFNIDEIRRLISDDTLVLDHCVAEGPTPGSKAKNLWNGEDRRYMPLVDPVTGQLLPGSPRDYTRYMRHAGESDPSRAGMLASVRDKNTGLPVATIEFQRNSNGTYSIGYASGYRNGHVKNAYHEAIKEYLNSRADMIEGSGSDLPNVGLLDLHSTETTGELQRILGVPRRDAGALLDAELANGTLPRFGTRDDLRQIFEKPQPVPATPQPVPATTQPAQRITTPNEMYGFLQELAQTTGRDESAAVADVLTRVNESFSWPGYSDLLSAQPTAFAERIAEFALEQDSAIVEQALLELADRIAPRVPPAQLINTATDMYNFLRDAARTMGVDESSAMAHVLRQVRQSFDGAPAYSELLSARPATFAQRIAELAQEQDNAIVEQALLELADRIIGARRQAAQPLNPPETWPLVGQQLAEQVQGAENLLVPAEQLATPQSYNAGAPLVPSTRLAIDDAFELVERELVGAGAAEATRRFEAFESDVRHSYFRPNATIDDLRAFRNRVTNAIEFYEQANPIQELADALRNALLPVVDALIAPPAVPVNAPVNARVGERQPLTFDARSFAQDLLEDARLDNQTFNVADLSTTLFTLDNGNFDDARFRALGENNAVSQRTVAGHLRQLMQDAGIPLPFAQQPAAPQRPALGVFEEFAIARDLLEDARLDNTTFNVPALRGMLSALENGRVNDPRFTGLGPQSAAAQLEVATALRQMMQDAGIPQQPAAPQQPTPQAQALIDNVRAADLADIVNFIEPNRWPLITARADRAAQGVYPADAATITEAIRNGQMPDITDGLDIIERELVAREVQQRIDDAARRQRPIAAQQPVVDTQARDNYSNIVRAAQAAAATPADVPIILRNAAAQTLDPVVEDALLDLAAQFETQLTGYEAFDAALDNLNIELTALAHEEGNWNGALSELDRMINELQHGAERVYGLWESDEPLTTPQQDYLAEQLSELRQEYEAHTAADEWVPEDDNPDWEPDDDHPANRPGFQEGGLVKYPNFIDAQNVATRRAQEMNPRADETDTEVDAARHMLASGYMAKSFNPTIAKGLGWLHEAKEAPFRTIGHALGLSNPRYDYEMDMHNNALGIELAKKAKDRADFERMVQESLKQSATTTTPGRPRVMTQKQAIEGTAALKYANGGTVPQTQSLDAMKYELMMRSK